jgi:putative FmdB family regulatory protein
MPTYDYQCDGPQHHRFERFQRFSEPPVTVCPDCEAAVHRVIHPVGVLFKGPGFYKTDNAPKAAAAESEGSAKESETPSEKAWDAPKKAAETKPKESKKAPAAPAATASQD